MFELPSPLHPMVVHFPIALFTMALVFEVIGLIAKNEGLQKSALNMYIAATLIAPIAVRTGVWEAEKLGVNHSVLDQHRLYAVWLMWTSLMSLSVLWFIHREFRKYFKIVFVAFLISSAVLVAFTGEEGGEMVYEYGVGVEE